MDIQKYFSSITESGKTTHDALVVTLEYFLELSKKSLFKCVFEFLTHFVSVRSIYFPRVAVSPRSNPFCTIALFSNYPWYFY